MIGDDPSELSGFLRPLSVDEPSLTPLGCTSIFTSSILAGFRRRLSLTIVDFYEEVCVAPGQLSFCVWGLINAF